MQLLIVKTTSLGDLIHTLPALNDAAKAIPCLKTDWLAERPFAEIPGWHPAVRRVIASDLRRWRKAPLAALRSGDWARFRSDLRQTRYDLVLDAQGLVKSAFLASRADGSSAGPDWASAREPLASLFYGRRLTVPPHGREHAITRTRRLFAAALGYPLPADLGRPPESGLDRARFAHPDSATPYALFLHGTTWPTKRWPLAHWQRLARWFAGRGIAVVLPWGSDAERADADAIAAASPNARVLPKLGLTAVAGWIAHARVIVGVDTGLMHLAAALGTPGLSLYGPTLPQMTGAFGRHQHWLCNDGQPPTIDRERPLTVKVERVIEQLPILLS
ncbi:MAG: lipopolysaccharide heptosyltransferase I [Xanthomonadaceae bacterium]|nr:lipopolysaccharide heptosyltransferase I [Xanthomonadaceae bacterium]